MLIRNSYRLTYLNKTAARSAAQQGDLTLQTGLFSSSDRRYEHLECLHDNRMDNRFQGLYRPDPQWSLTT